MSTAAFVCTTPIENSDSLFTVSFNSTHSIVTTVTASAAAAAAWISDILAFHSRRLDSLIVGLDAEWRPGRNPVAVLQLCVGRHCLVFQLLHADAIPPVLLSFLADPRFRFVGVCIGQDADKLIEDYLIVVKNAVDLRALAAERMGKRELKQAGLARLAMEVMGVEVEKSKQVTLSWWDQEFLMPDQIGYACVDAFLSFEIGRRLFFTESSTTPEPSKPNALAENSTTPAATASNVHPIRFCGRVIRAIVTADSSVAEKWMKQVSSNGQKLVVGVATERNPNADKIATLQLCLKKTCLILQLSRMKQISEFMKDFFGDTDGNISFRGLRISDVDSQLWSGYGIYFRNKEDLDGCVACVQCTRCFNFSSFCVCQKKKKLRLKDLARDLLGIHLKRPKHVQVSDWEAEVLTEGQIKCATASASVARRLAHELE